MPRAKVRDDITKEALEKCLQENMSILEISIELRANYGTIAKRLKEYGLKRNPRKVYTKYDKELLSKYLEEGKSITEIAKLFDVCHETAKRWIRVSGLKKREEVPQERKCPDCVYRSASSSLGNCDYIGKTGRRRECPADNCTKYVSDSKRRKKKNDIQKP